MEYVVGLDLGGTNIKGGIVSSEGDIIVARSIKTHISRGADKVLSAMAVFARELIEESGREVQCGGVGSPGPLSQVKGEVYNSPNLPGWDTIQVIAALEEQTGMDFVLENDANAACLGEKVFGAGQPFDPIIHLTLGTGLGGGVFLNGQLFAGPTGAGAELGHMTIDINGIQCGCGNYGCLETFASDTGIRRFLEQELPNVPDSLLNNFKHDNLNFKVVTEAAAKADALAVKTYDRFVYGLGVGIANLVNIFNPQAVILSGGSAREASNFMPELERLVSERAFDVLVSDLKILVSTLGNNTGVLGAAACALKS